MSKLGSMRRRIIRRVNRLQKHTDKDISFDGRIFLKLQKAFPFVQEDGSDPTSEQLELIARATSIMADVSELWAYELELKEKSCKS